VKRNTKYEMQNTKLDTIRKSLSSPQLRKLERFGGKVNKFGVNFAVCNADGELVLLCEGGKFKSGRKHLIDASRRALNKEGEGSCAGTETQICRFGETNPVLAAVLKRGSEAVGAALIDLDTEYSNQESILGEMLGLLAENFQAEAEAEEQIEMVGTELAQTYEELVLLHKLSTNMKVTEPDANFLQIACDSLTEIVPVEGIAVVLEKTIENEKQLVVTAGSGLIDIDERMAAVLHSWLVEEINSGKEALLDSEVDSPFKYDWPGSIKNIITVPLFGKDRVESHFAERTQDGNCVIGALEEDQIHKIYLAGLLHDIGKIGIDEAVLCKQGKLTEQELSRIRKHPSIGAGILREIKQMRDIVPGVLCHHEQVDGKGYPNGLVGEQIPLTGKIVGLADSFDAMTSKRTYRDALTVEQALAEIERGLGTQFDEKVGRVFINSDVYQLWDIMRDSFSEIYRRSSSVEYGTAAVGTLIR